MDKINYKNLLISCIALLEDTKAVVKMNNFVQNFKGGSTIHDHDHPFWMTYYLHPHEVKSHLHDCGSSCCWIGHAVATLPDCVALSGRGYINWHKTSETLFNISPDNDKDLWQYLFGGFNINSAGACAIRLLGLLSPIPAALFCPWLEMNDDERYYIMLEILESYGLSESLLRASNEEHREILLPILKEKLKAYE